MDVGDATERRRRGSKPRLPIYQAWSDGEQETKLGYADKGWIVSSEPRATQRNETLDSERTGSQERLD